MSSNHTLVIGKYRISPLVKALDDSTYRASVSIRSGQGLASCDRVIRFTGRFESAEAAARYAQEQAILWTQQPVAS